MMTGVRYRPRKLITAGVRGRLLLDAVLREVVAERALADPEQRGRVLLDPTRAHQRLLDALALRPFDIRAQLLRREAGGRGAGDARHRDVPRLDHGTAGEDDRALDRVLQLADVARPVVRVEPRQRLLADLLDLAAAPMGVLAQEMLDEHRNVLAT